MEKSIATYCYVNSAVTPAATATDVFVLSGAPGKKITIASVSIAGTANAASIYDVYLIKRSAPDTGGTATNPACTKMDSKDTTAGGVIGVYTANPTGLGASLGVIDADHIFLTAGTAPASAQTHRSWDFCQSDAKCPILYAGEQFAVNFNGAAVPAGASMFISIVWMES